MFLDLKCSLEVNGLKTWSPVLVPWEGTETFKRQDIVEWEGMRTLGVGLDSSFFFSLLSSFHGATRPPLPLPPTMLCCARAGLAAMD